MNKILITVVVMAGAAMLWVGDKFGGLTSDLKGVLPAVTQTGGDLIGFVRSVEHPLILAAIVIVAVLVAYRIAKTILLIGAVVVLLFVLVEVLPAV